MKPWKSRFTLLVGVILCVFLLPGCWDYQSIAKRATIAGIGIDSVEDEPEKMRVTIQYPLLSQSPGTSGGSGSGTSSTDVYQTLSTEAYSISEALKKLQRMTAYQLELAQLRGIIVSRHLSTELMDSAISQLMRYPRTNHLAYIYTTPSLARDILTIKETQSSPIDFISKATMASEGEYFTKRQLWQYWRDNTQVGSLPVLPIVIPTSSEESGRVTLSLGGDTAYINNKAAFDLSPADCLYVNLLSEHSSNMVINTNGSGGIISLINARSNNHRYVITDGEKLVLVDHVTIFATLGKIGGHSTKPLPQSNLNKVESETSDYLRSELTKTMKNLQDKHADICGFGRIYLRKHPGDEEKVKEEWGNMFKHAKLDIEVNVSIVSKGMLI